MRPWLVAVLVCVALAGSAPDACRAAPSLLGPQGAIVTPTADTVGAGCYALALSHKPGWNYISAGCSPLGSVEVGATIVDPTKPRSVPTRVGLSAKALLVREGALAPSVALGLWDIFRWVERTPYAVASKNVGLPMLRRPVRASVGYGDGALRGAFASVAVPFSPAVTGMVEYDGFHLNVGTRVVLPRGFAVNASLIGRAVGLGGAFGAAW